MTNIQGFIPNMKGIHCPAMSRTLATVTWGLTESESGPFSVSAES